MECVGGGQGKDQKTQAYDEINKILDEAAVRIEEIHYKE